MEIISILNPWLLACFGAVLSLVVWLIKRFVERVRRIEERQMSLVSREECRDMIDDRLHPMQRQLEKVDEKLDKVIDVLITGRACKESCEQKEQK